MLTKTAGSKQTVCGQRLTQAWVSSHETLQAWSALRPMVHGCVCEMGMGRQLNYRTFSTLLPIRRIRTAMIGRVSVSKMPRERMS